MASVGVRKSDRVEPSTDFGSIIDQLTADKGWSLEYTLCLTWRQTEALYERYWDRKIFELQLLGKVFHPAPKDNTVHHDASTDEGLAEAMSAVGATMGKIPAKAI